MAPTLASGQTASSAQRTHVVKAGESLASLAREYLGDVHRWSEIYQLNKSKISDPNRIPPGITLALPPKDSKAASTRMGPASAARSDNAKPVAKQTTATPRPVETPADAGPQQPVAARTIFYHPERAGSDTSRVSGRAAPTARPTIRVGEYLAAPYIDRDGGPRGAGRILSSAEVSAFPVSSSPRTMTLEDRIAIAPPQSGPSATIGDRYLAFMLGPAFYGFGQVVIPTGVVVVDKTAAGEPVEARIVAAFEAITSGQGLIPIGAAPPLSLPRPARTSSGAATSVLWVEGSPALATLQSYVVLGAGSTSGLAVGDQVTLEQRTTSPSSPPAPIARAVVVRVTPRSSTAFVIEQAQAEIRAGVRARVTAKMP